MSALRATLSCTRLQGLPKQGIIRPDADGYYSIVVGGLDVFNSAGAFYEHESAKALFAESSSLMRRICAGQLRGEYGHPKREVGMTDAQYMNRILTLEETRVSHHIRKIIIDSESVKDEKTGRPVTVIIAELKPAGPYAQALRESFENGFENVSFSIRSITTDSFENGIIVKRLMQIVTWDFVIEPGIKYAEKYKSPALETLSEQTIIPGNLVQLADYRKSRGLGIESGEMISVEEIAASLGWGGYATKPPVTSKSW